MIFPVRAKYGEDPIRSVLRSCNPERQITCLLTYSSYARMGQIEGDLGGPSSKRLPTTQKVHVSYIMLCSGPATSIQFPVCSNFGIRGGSDLSLLLFVRLDPSYKLFKTIGSFVCSFPSYFIRQKTHSQVTPWLSTWDSHDTCETWPSKGLSFLLFNRKSFIRSLVHLLCVKGSLCTIVRLKS